MNDNKLHKKLEDYKNQLQWSLKKEQQLKDQLFELHEQNTQLRAEVERMKEELVAYQIGSSIEAKAGDEARAECDRLKALLEAAIDGHDVRDEYEKMNGEK